MRKRSLLKVLFPTLAALLVLSGSAFADPTEGEGKKMAPKVHPNETKTISFKFEGDPVDLSEFTRNAPIIRQGNHIAGLPRHFVTIVEETDGTLSAVVDYTVPGAPKGHPRIDAPVLMDLGISRYRIVTYNDESPVKSAKQEPEDVNATVAFGTEYRSYPWEYVRTWKSETYTSDIPLLQGGCANRTGSLPIDCALTTTATASVKASSNLSIAKLFSLGFEVGFTVNQQLTATVRSIPPGYWVKIQPKAQWLRQLWDEKFVTERRTCYFGICGDWEIAYVTWGVGEGEKPTLVYYDVFLEPAPN